MKTMTQIPTMLDILAMARSLLIERYQEQKSQCVTHWQIQNEYAWSTGSDIMPCPEMPEYPTTDEILALSRHIAQYFQEQSEHDDHQVTVTEEPALEPFPVATDMTAPEPDSMQRADHAESTNQTQPA